MTILPTGTVTFLYTDIVGSTHLVLQLGDHYAGVLADYRRLMLAVVQERNGYLVNAEGDACLLVFARAGDAVAAAVEAQRALANFPWPRDTGVHVRMGLHTGAPLRVGTDYIGIDVHRAARIGSAGHGGQILLSEATSVLVWDDLPERSTLRDLGEYRLKDLVRPQHLFQVVVSDLPSDFPPLQSPERVPNNLPVQLTSFIGREREIAEMKRLLFTTRLLTLTGAGGAGKTRLALQLAAEVLEEFKAGVWLVELASVADPVLVAQRVATALSVREQPGKSMLVTLANFIERKRLLLVLDNCEHLLAECAQVTYSLLRVCRDLRILATSREPMGIGGETSLRVPSLSLPDVRRPPSLKDLTKYESVRLFVERATAADPTFKISEQNAQAIAWVCYQLDGIPLALELAAARVRGISVEQIASRLEDRFWLLTGGNRAALPQHQTLRAAMDWSFQLLSEPERAVFRRLSVFAAGFTLEAAESVCAGPGVEASEVLNLLALLANKSLILVEDRDGKIRYRSLETVRQYTREKLLEAGEFIDARRRHTAWYLEFVERAQPELFRAEQSTWLDLLEDEHDNFREALAWSLEGGDKEGGLRLTGALYWFWEVRGHLTEARKWLETALSENRGASSLARAKALHAAGSLAYSQHEYERAMVFAEECLAQSHQIGEKRSIARSHFLLGYIALGRGDLQRAMEELQQSVVLFQELADKRGIGISLNMLGEVARCLGDYSEARRLYEEDLSLRRELGDERGIGISLHNLGYVGRHRGDYARAIELFKESLAIRLKLGHKMGIANCLAGLAGVAAAQSRPEMAARLLGATEALLAVMNAELDRPDKFEYDRTMAVVREALGETAFEVALLEGKVMPLEQAIECALNI